MTGASKAGARREKRGLLGESPGRRPILSPIASSEFDEQAFIGEFAQLRS
jgi:hypothetical protein